MTINSIGYPGQLGPAQFAAVAARLGSSYQVSNLEVSATPGGTRQVTIGPQDPDVPCTIGGHGVFDEITASETTAQAPVVTGVAPRYDLYVARRTWAAKTTTIERIDGTGVPAIPARYTEPGVVDDQPLALVEWLPNATDPGRIRPLGVWQHNGGTVAADELALDYLDAPGSQVRIGDDLWQQIVTVNDDGEITGTPWRRVGLLNLPVFGVGGVLDGVKAADQSQFLVQAGSAVVKTSNGGHGELYLPRPFPNGLLSVILQNGDDAASNDTLINVAGGGFGASTGNRGRVTFRAWGPLGAGVRVPLPNWHVRVNYIAIGW